MEKEQAIIYIDAKGVEHTALLVAKDQRHEGFVSLVYINGEVAQRLDSVVHESDPSKDEANPDLKRVALNCWKEAATPPLAMGVGTSSTGELPAAGIFKVPTAADLDAYADEQKAKEAAIEAAAHPPTTETKHYADGSSATGPGPLPDHSPEGAPEVPAPTEAPTV